MAALGSETVELIRSCAQVYWLLRNYVVDSRNDSNVSSAEFDQTIYGPDKEEWPGSPVGFSWDVEFIFKNGKEENITLEVIFESEWIVSAETSKHGKDGSESVETLFEFCTSDTMEAVLFLLDASKRVIEYSIETKAINA